jgi:formylglycine-generating enzyme required for sulfatase activity
LLLHRYKVTNGEFLQFVKAGGYIQPKYWSADGWGWKTFRNVKWPTFWVPDGPQGLHRCDRHACMSCG